MWINIPCHVECLNLGILFTLPMKKTLFPLHFDYTLTLSITFFLDCCCNIDVLCICRTNNIYEIIYSDFHEAVYYEFFMSFDLFYYPMNGLCDWYILRARVVQETILNNKTFSLFSSYLIYCIHWPHSTGTNHDVTKVSLSPWRFTYDVFTTLYHVFFHWQCEWHEYSIHSVYTYCLLLRDYYRVIWFGCSWY